MKKRRKCTNIIMIASTVCLLVTFRAQSIITLSISAINVWFCAAFLISNFCIIVEDNKEFVEKRIKEKEKKENDRKN